MSKKCNWVLEGTIKDPQSVSPQWETTNLNLIDGVKVKEVKTVIKNNGYLTEIYRNDWGLDDKVVGQVFQVNLSAGGISAWHAHQITTDRIFVNTGLIKIVLYDSRDDSPTYGQSNEFRCGLLRPVLIVIPPMVWHGIHNFTNENASLLNIVDKEYQYDNPDHWRLPLDSKEIPYSFS